MAMKTSEEKFKSRVSQQLTEQFMRGAVSSAQERFQTRRAVQVEEIGADDWEK